MQNPKTEKASFQAFIWFFISLAVCFSLTAMIVINKINSEKLNMEQVATLQSTRIIEVVKKQFYKTYALAALVVQAKGRVNNFDELASFLLDDNSILSLALAPDGVVSDVFPHADNELVIGTNFLAEGAGHQEAIDARETGHLVLGGPFELSQGGEGLIGQMPVYLDTPAEKHKFWGLVSITLKFPQALEDAGLNLLSKQGFSYTLWKTHPDTDEKQIIDSSLLRDDAGSNFIENHIHVLNADWYLKIWPLKSWYHYPENISLIVASIFISFLVMLARQNNIDLKGMKTSLEILAQHDPLTGIYNKRWFVEMSKIHLERTRRLKKDSFVILFDLDHFKHINENYGPLAGDDVLMQTATCIKSKIRLYDVFARYGGEEFIISVFDIDHQDVNNLAERLRAAIESEKFLHENIGLQITASFGVAQVIDYNLNRTIQAADEALYSAKHLGRNKVVFYSDLAL
jgi:diguanylate cyclase (GGDEF)-like protein